jgi:hypothetical protein
MATTREDVHAFVERLMTAELHDTNGNRLDETNGYGERVRRSALGWALARRAGISAFVGEPSRATEYRYRRVLVAAGYDPGRDDDLLDSLIVRGVPSQSAGDQATADNGHYVN